MKKLLVLCIIMILVLTGCVNPNNQTESKAVKEIEVKKIEVETIEVEEILTEEVLYESNIS